MKTLERTGGPLCCVRDAAQGPICRRQLGFTLFETLVAVSILAAVMTMASGGMYQALSVRRGWQDRMTAVKDLRHAGSWFAGDALNAESTDLVDGAPPAGSVTLGWTDGAGTPHTASYHAVGGDLVREYDGAAMVVAREMQSVSFSLSARVLTFQLAVTAAPGQAESTTLTTYLRVLQ